MPVSTHFLNVDLDVYAPYPLGPLARAMEECGALTLHSGRWWRGGLPGLVRSCRCYDGPQRHHQSACACRRTSARARAKTLRSGDTERAQYWSRGGGRAACVRAAAQYGVACSGPASSGAGLRGRPGTISRCPGAWRTGMGWPDSRVQRGGTVAVSTNAPGVVMAPMLPPPDGQCCSYRR
jgi:hypothetical protein